MAAFRLKPHPIPDAALDADIAILGKKGRGEPDEAALALVRTLRAQEIKTAVVSSSNHCAAVLEAAGISHLFDARVDGKDIARLALNGKPAPDAFLEAARRVTAEPSRSVVVEDAIAGIEAGRAGRFGCVIGVDGGQSQDLREAGADFVVNSLGQVKVTIEPPSEWSLVYENSNRRVREPAKPCAPWGMAISRLAGQQSGHARTIRTIPAPTLPAATTECARMLRVGWWRTRIWLIFRTGSRLDFASGMRTGSMPERSSFCHIDRNSISSAAYSFEP